MATKAAFPSSTCPLTREPPSVVGASPPGGVFPATGGRGSAAPAQRPPAFSLIPTWTPSRQATLFQLA